MKLFPRLTAVLPAFLRPLTKTNACPPAAFLRFAPLLLAALAPLAMLRAQSNYATPYTFTTLAGTASAGSIDGTGSAARFSGPDGVAVDGSGNLYVADTHNNLVRKVTSAGVITTIAGSIENVGSVDGTGSSAQFDQPQDIAVDSAGNLYVADTVNFTIRKITPTVVSGVTNWVVTTIAGSAGNLGSVDGTGSAARFDYPSSVAVDQAGNLYVADRNTIRQITPSVVGGVTNWVVTTLAGNGYNGSADGTGSAAQFNGLHGIAVDGAGNLYVSDALNTMIREVTPTVVSGVTNWVVTTIAGSAGNQGFTDGTGSAAKFNQLQGNLAVDRTGNLYVADWNSIRQITPTVVNGVTNWVVTTLPNSVAGGASFSWPQGVAVDSAGKVFVADTDNNSIREMTPSVVNGVTNWMTTTVAGFDGGSGYADGTGSAAQFSYPQGIAVDGTGNVYVGDTAYATIRQITPAGVVTTIAGYHYGWGGSTDGTGSEARFADPYGVAVDKTGDLYVADTTNDTIRKITPTVVSGVTNWVVTTLAGSAGNQGSADGTGTAALFNWPRGVAVDSSGNVYVADTGNGTIRKITPAGVVTTLAGSAGNTDVTDGTGTFAEFNYPTCIAISGAGNLYVTDDGCLVRQITPGAVVTTIAGSPAGYGGFADGTGRAAQFKDLQGIASDSAGDLYIADTGNNLIRKITPTVVNGVTNWVVTTLAGTRASIGSSDGTGSAVQFQYPGGIAVDSAGNVYVADTNNNTIRKGVGVAVAASPAITEQPERKVTTPGTTVTFTTAASGTPTPTYQWQGSTNGGSTWANLTDTAPYGGTATGTLTITGAAFSMNGYQYRCVATNGVSPAATSNAATLTIKPWAVTATGLFEGGAKAGLLWSNTTTSETAIWLMNGLTCTGGVSYAPGTGWTVVGTGDFDGDGKTDLLWRNAATGGVVIWFMNGTAIAGSKWIYDSGTEWIPFKLADFNGDGKTDILWRNTVTGDYAFWLMNGSGELLGASGFAVTAGWEIAQVADFDGDGKADIMWRNTTTGGIVLWFMNGTAIKSSPWIYEGGLSWTPAYVADFNGDGKADILWQNTDGSLAIWLMNGTGPLLGASGFSVAAGWQVALVADFDGDGKADILWRNSTTGGVVLWTMNGTGASSYAWVYDSGLSWTPVRAADFNGDGKADILWQNTDGSLAIWLMNGGTCLSSAGVY